MSAANELAAQLTDPAGLGRLLTRIENDPAARAEVLAELPQGPRAQRIGITGAPGVGKSTLLSRLVPLLGARASCPQGESGNKVGSASSAPPHSGAFAVTDQQAGRMPALRGPALLAVDPSSAQTGGAVLADRYRFNELAEQGVFVRSLASRGSLGGASAAASATVRVLEAAGYGPLLIETVGVGQTGTEICALADTVVVLLSPESGDALQLLKAGLIETGDIFVVNKADRPGAEALYSALLAELEDGQANSGWQPPVLAVSGLNGDGIEELAEAIARHHAWLEGLAENDPRSLNQVQLEIELTARALLEDQLSSALANSPDLVASVASGELSVEAAATELLRRSGV